MVAWQNYVYINLCFAGSCATIMYAWWHAFSTFFWNWSHHISFRKHGLSGCRQKHCCCICLWRNAFICCLSYGNSWGGICLLNVHCRLLIHILFWLSHGLSGCFSAPCSQLCTCCLQSLCSGRRCFCCSCSWTSSWLVYYFTFFIRACMCVCACLWTCACAVFSHKTANYMIGIVKFFLSSCNKLDLVYHINKFSQWIFLEVIGIGFVHVYSTFPLPDEIFIPKFFITFCILVNH